MFVSLSHIQNDATSLSFVWFFGTLPLPLTTVDVTCGCSPRNFLSFYRAALSSSSVVHRVPLWQVPRMKNEGVFYYIFYSLVSLCAAPLIAALLYLFWKLVLWTRTQIWPDEDEDRHPLDPAEVRHHHHGFQGDGQQGTPTFFVLHWHQWWHSMLAIGIGFRLKGGNTDTPH